MKRLSIHELTPSGPILIRSKPVWPSVFVRVVLAGPFVVGTGIIAWWAF